MKSLNLKSYKVESEERLIEAIESETGAAAHFLPNGQLCVFKSEMNHSQYVVTRTKAGKYLLSRAYGVENGKVVCR